MVYLIDTFLRFENCVVLRDIFALNARYIPPKQWFYRHFSNFFSDYARILFFRHNDFECGVNNLRNPIARHWQYFSLKWG